MSPAEAGCPNFAKRVEKHVEEPSGVGNRKAHRTATRR